MATNYIQPGDVITVAAPAAVSSGDGVQVGQIFGVAQFDAAITADVEVATTGVWTLPKTSAQAWDAGDAIYWDDGNSRCDNTAVSGGLFIGVATAAAANPSSTGTVRLNGSFPAA